MYTGGAAGPEDPVGTIGDIVEGSIDSFMPAGDFREPFEEEDFTEIPAAVIGIRDGGAGDEVSVDGE